MELAQNIGSISFNIQDLFSMLKFVSAKSKLEKKVVPTSVHPKQHESGDNVLRPVAGKQIKSKSRTRTIEAEAKLDLRFDLDFSIISMTELIKVLTNLMVELDGQIVKMSKEDAANLIGEVGKHPELVELMHNSVDNFEPDSVEEFNLNLAMRGLVNQFTIVFEKLTFVANRETFDEESANYREFLYDLISESPLHNNRAIVVNDVDDLFNKL